MEKLTENIIKRIALSYLKVYYKHRPRIGETIGQLDLQTQSGIVSDGQLSFVTEEGKNFIAAFEATAYDTRNEVYFQKQNRLLAWDAAAFAAICSMVIIGLFHRYNFLTISQIGVFLTCFSLLLSLFLFALLYRFLFGRLGRYRYIYAVEQFKKFHADEQWIVVESSVFSGPADPNFLELRKQCILNGFGLLEILSDQQPRLLITPSREVVFEKKRRIAQFFQTNKLRKRVAETSVSKNLQKAAEKIKPETGGGKNIRRYQKSLWHQLTIISFAFVFIGFIFYRQMLDRPVVVLNENENRERLQNLDNQRRETDTFEIDLKNKVPKSKKPQPYLKIDETKAMEPPAPSASKSKINVADKQGGIDYDCSRFYNLVGVNYILADSEYADFEKAAARLAILRKAKLEANCLWLGCFDAGDDVFVVYLDLIFEDKNAALKMGDEYDKVLKKNKLWSNPISVIPIKSPK